MLKPCLLLFIMLLPSFFRLHGMSESSLMTQENPFIQMANEPYSSYFEYLQKNIYKGIETRDSAEAALIAYRMREAARLSKNKKWNLEAGLFEVLHRMERNVLLHKPDQAQMDNLTACLSRDIQPIVQRAKQIGAFDIELRAIYRVWSFYYYHSNNYEMAFRYSLILDEALSKVSAEEFPFRHTYYAETGRLYLSFGENEAAVAFFEKGLEGAEITRNRTVTHLSDIKQLWNSVGLIYRNHYNDLEKSDSCFRKILEIEFQTPVQSSSYDIEYMRKEHELWRGLATGNLGTNCYMRGENDSAIPLLQYSIKHAVAYNDYNFPYAIGKALLLCRIFLSISDMAQAKLYAGMAGDYLNRLQARFTLSDKKTNIELWASYYGIMSSYFRMAGNDSQALLYADSTAEARSQVEDEYSIRILHRVEQQARQEKLDAELLRNIAYRQSLYIVSLFVILLLALLTLLYRLYRQKRNAYRALVIKTQQWAQEPYIRGSLVYSPENPAFNPVNPPFNPVHPAEKDSLPTSANLQLFDRLNRLVIERKAYLKPDISLDRLAQLMDINRTYLSNAVNQCTGNSFSAYINEFRVKEAVRLMSDKKSRNYSIEGIATDAGFSDRTTFHRAFKKSTGFSPTTFRKNTTV